MRGWLLALLCCAALASRAEAAPDVLAWYRKLPASLFRSPDRRMDWLRSPGADVDLVNQYLNLPRQGSQADLQMTLFEVGPQDAGFAVVATGSGPLEQQTLHLYRASGAGLEDVLADRLPWPYDPGLRYVIPREGGTVPVSDTLGTHVFDLVWARDGFRMSGLSAVLLEPMDTVLFDRELNANLTAVANGVFSLPAATAIDHHWTCRRRHFDTEDVTLTWAGHWKADNSRVASSVQSGLLVRLGKTVRLNVRPSGGRVYVETAQQDAELTLLVNGRVVSARVLPETDGAVVVPHAWEPPDLLIVHPGFEPYRLHIPTGALDTEATVYPPTSIQLQPRYGWFSYAWFYEVVGLGALILAAIVLRRRRVVSPEPPPTAVIPVDGDGRTLVEVTLKSERGRHYRLLGRLGSGGMGVVFEALDVEAPTSPAVAVKVMLDSKGDSTLRARFEREIQICARLQHPSIVNVSDWGHWHGAPFMIMERLHGETLSNMIARQPGRWPVATVVRWLQEILQGLDVAHAAGIVHRDLKPGNLMVTEDGHIKVLDFGLARDLDRTPLTLTGALFGTPHYMSPEHLDARTVSPRSDIDSLGVVAYHLLSGRNPFHGHTDVWAIVTHILVGKVPQLSEDNSDGPWELRAVVNRMMAHAPPDRYPDAGAVLQALSSLPPL